MEDNIYNRRKMFAVAAVISIILCYLLVYVTWPKPVTKVDKPNNSTSQTTCSNAGTTAAEYEPKDSAMRAKIDKQLKDFLPAFVEMDDKMSSEEYGNRIKPYLTGELYQQLKGGELPPVEKNTCLISKVSVN